jgi:outer membrane protein TolC
VSLSAVLGIPLYDGGTTRAKVKEAQSDLRSQVITRDQLRQNVVVEILQALSNVSDAQTRAASAGVGATTAQEAVRLANVRYQNGIGTILDVENAEANLATAQLNLLNAQYDYQTSLAQLTRAIGGR